MKWILPVLLALLSWCPLHAGEAVFSADGKTIYALPWHEAGLWKIDLATGEGEVVALPKEMGEVELVGLARSNSGFILLATPKEVWAWDAAKNKAVKQVSMPENSFYDVSYIPSLSALVMDGSDFQSTYLAPKGWKVAGKMFTRRSDGAARFAFDDKEHAFFSIGGDLWVGTLAWWDSEEKDRPKELTSVEEADTYAHNFGPDAARVMALGALQSNSSNQRNVIIHSIAVSTTRVYVWLGNRDVGELISLPKKPLADLATSGASDNLTDASAFIKLSGSLAAATKFYPSITHAGKRPWLCSSPDHKKIFVRGMSGEEGALFMITDDGEPKKVAKFMGDE